MTLATRPSRRPRRPISVPQPPTRGLRTHARRRRGPAKTPARELDQVRADTERERDEILARLTDTASRLSQVTTAHAEELAQLRADAARERDELRAALESRAQVLEESRGELRARAERAERELDAERAEVARVRQESGTAAAPSAPKRPRAGQE